jgi:hypothetical protein
VYQGFQWSPLSSQLRTHQRSETLSHRRQSRRTWLPPVSGPASKSILKKKKSPLGKVVSSSAAPSPSPHRTSNRPAAARSCSRALSPPRSLPSMKRLLWRILSGPSPEALGPFPCCSTRLRRNTIQCRAHIHLARRETEGRGGQRLWPHPPCVFGRKGRSA